nr:unnamed protein product [Spirometra erinaceieuropaei]
MVDSGVPQGSVLGPILFLIYVDDAARDLDCEVAMFADDMKIWSVIQGPADEDRLQMNLNRLEEWSNLWLLRFNVAKCSILRLGNTARCASTRGYFLGGAALQEVKAQRDLGVLTTSSLKPSAHCSRVAKTAMSVLSFTEESYTQQSPGPPTNLTVHALRAKSLEVRWKNPDNASAAVTSASCSLTGLMDFTVYNVTVHVCVSPLEVGRGNWVGGGCSATSPVSRQTLPGEPDMANNITVYARQRNSLEVSWINPDATHGPLVSATAIGFWQGKKLATCRASILPGQPANCTLTNLEDFTEYAVSVEACVAPVRAGFVDLGGGCSMTPSISGITLPGVFEAEHLADLGRQITNSKQTVEDPSTQISIKVALSSLPTEHVGPVSYVTAYIEPANQTDLTRERRSAEKFSFLSGSYNNNTWEPWEVLVRDFRGDPSYKAEDFFFTIGQPSGSQTCDHCYNGPLAPDTLYSIGLRVYTDTGAGTTELSLLKTAHDQSIVRLDRNWVTYCANQHPVGPLESEVLGVYVNANYVKACRYDSRGQAQIATDSSLPEYIATQGPLTHTEADFLYMVHQQRVPIVITLCNTLEGGKSKCAQYWPDSEGITEEKGNPVRSVDVTLNHETRTANVVTRSMTVKPEEEADSWTFTQLHFLSWADHAVPPIAEFYDFLKNYAFLRKQKPLSRVFGPTLVHCSAFLERMDDDSSSATEQLRFLYDFIDYCIREEGIQGCSPTVLQPRPLPLQFLTPGGPPPAYTPNNNTDRNTSVPPQAIQLQPLPPRPASPLEDQQARSPAPDLSVAATRPQAPVSVTVRPGQFTGAKNGLGS